MYKVIHLVNTILLVNLVNMTYSYITCTSWKLNKGPSTADKQPPYN